MVELQNCRHGQSAENYILLGFSLNQDFSGSTHAVKSQFKLEKKIQFIKLDFSNSIFQNSSVDRYRTQISRLFQSPEQTKGLENLTKRINEGRVLNKCRASNFDSFLRHCKHSLLQIFPKFNKFKGFGKAIGPGKKQGINTHIFASLSQDPVDLLLRHLIFAISEIIQLPLLFLNTNYNEFCTLLFTIYILNLISLQFQTLKYIRST